VKHVKTARLRQKVKDYLRGGPKSTAEILDHINMTSRHGTTTQQLGNILSKDMDIIKVGYVRRLGSRYGSYNICEWCLREQLPEEEEPTGTVRQTRQQTLAS
jgi:hypothetical protein